MIIRFSVFCLIGCIFFTALHGHAGSIDADTAIRLIREKEKEISSIRFQCRLQWDKGLDGMCKILLDTSGRFRIDMQGMEPTRNNKNKTVAINDIHTFDGNVYRQQSEHQRNNANPESKAPPRGTIKEKTADLGNQGMATRCIRYFYPYFFSLTDDNYPGTLSEYLKSRQKVGLPVHVEETDKGQWEISTVHKEFAIPKSTKGVRYYTHILYAPDEGRAGAILRVVVSRHEEFAASLAHKAGWNTPYGDMVYDLQKVGSFRVPRSVRVIHDRGNGSTTETEAEYAYSQVEINRPLAQHDYEIAWKKGTNVIDEVAKQRYVVTGSPIDELESVERYRNAHKLKEEINTSTLPDRHSRYVSWGVFALLLVLIFLLAYRSRKHWKSSSLLIILIVPNLIAWSTACRAENAKMPKESAREEAFVFDNGWWRVSDGIREARITQCAFYVTTFTLNYFNIPCNPVFISENLPPSPRGVSLDKIQRLLQAHGLDAEGRKNVRLEDLLHLPAGACAIVALPIPRAGDHYFVIGRSEEGLFCADVPWHVVFLDKISKSGQADLEKKLAERQGVVLLVRRHSESVDFSRAIHISPEQADLGDFPVICGGTVPKKFRPEITFSNTSSRPVAVSIKTSCGCVGNMTWKNKIIDVGSREKLVIEISPTAWGIEKHREEIAVIFPDSTQKILSITGAGYAGEGTKSFHLVSPKELTFQIHEEDARTYRKNFQVEVVASPGVADSLQAESSVSWLRPSTAPVLGNAETVTPQSDSRRIIFTIAGSDKLLNELCEYDNTVSGLITITAKPSGLQTRCSILLKREPRISAAPRIVYLDRNNITTTVTIQTKGKNFPAIKTLTATAKPDGLAYSIRKEGIAYFLELQPTPAARSRHFVVTCHAELENGDRDSGIVIADIAAK